MFDLVAEPRIVRLILVPASDRIAHQHAEELGGVALLGVGDCGKARLEIFIDPERERGIRHVASLFLCARNAVHGNTPAERRPRPNALTGNGLTGTARRGYPRRTP